MQFVHCVLLLMTRLCSTKCNRFVAGAACPKEIIDFMDAIGIPVCEGYGKSADSPLVETSFISFFK